MILPLKLNKIFYLLIFSVVVSYAQEKKMANAMPVAKTIPIDTDDSKDSIILKAAHVVPTENQYEALQNEFIAFIHFGPNTFTRMEWGNGMENPEVFDLHELDTDQWCKAMKEANMKMVVITVKHHDGFCLWQTRYTKHGIMSTPYKNGKGDILKELSASAKKYGLKLGVYLSPADLYQIENKNGLYGNLSKTTKRIIPRQVEGRPFANKKTFEFEVDDYNEYFLNQLFELLTEYGPIHEVWFDGAHPKRKGGQTYNYLAWKELIHTLAPKAVIFGKEDIRWCGNESGKTRDTEWNVIPFKQDPNNMNIFPDLTNKDLGSREKLYDAEFLQYQQAETNTSIREGWFYRNDTDQKVRSADDVFDIYERAVGGNSTFLLNIPPNRQGKFSPKDVATLEETGRRIRKTYGTNLLANASGVKEVLDNNDKTFVVLEGTAPSLEFNMPEPIKINRLMIQEDIRNHGERIEEHVLEAWIDGAWKEIAKATNVGYKRILRFPEVTTNKLRLRILKSRYIPIINHVSAHFYHVRPPQLTFTRNLEGLVTIAPKQHEFRWKPHGENAVKNINSGIRIVYTTDGSDPTSNSKTFKNAFILPNGQVKAMAIADDKKGSIATAEFGIVKKGWKVLKTDSNLEKHEAENAIDANPNTYWQSKSNGNTHYFNLDLGSEVELTGFSYTPPLKNKDGMIEKGIFLISHDGKSWKTVGHFKFGNLINDPTTRKHDFSKPVKTRFIRILSKEIAGNKKSAAIAELDFFIN